MEMGGRLKLGKWMNIFRCHGGLAENLEEFGIFFIFSACGILML